MRISLTEYGDGINLNDLFQDTDSYENVVRLAAEANKKIQKNLSISRNALVITDGKLRALGIAGTIRLSKDIEVEIAPKLFTHDDGNRWKESIFLLAALSKYGKIITNDHIHSNTSYKDSLYDIAGRILVDEYKLLRRKPLRRYRHENFSDFIIDGEIDFGSISERNPNGIKQERVVFDKKNSFNATIKEAMTIVLPYTKDNSVKYVLQKAIQEYGQQAQPSRQRLRIPPRNKEWTTIYNLSYDIIAGMGSSLESGEIMSPSFIVDTWRIWEWLVTIGIKIGLGNDYSVVPQAITQWGAKESGQVRAKVNVFPDVAIYKQNDRSTPVLLVDAKYKVLEDMGNSEIDRSDLYESYAFCDATGCKTLLLAFPSIANTPDDSGNTTAIAKYSIKDTAIIATKVAFGSVQKQGDLSSFFRRMAAYIITFAEINR